jgi:hypothetical protein
MGENLKYLGELFKQLQLEVEKQLGHPIYPLPYDSRKGYRLFARENKKGNFGYVKEKSRADKRFPECSLPHLVIATKGEWADRAGIRPDAVREDGWHDAGESEVYWCLSQDDSLKLKLIANNLKEIYLVSPAQREWQQGEK